jgi:hypothetical protein
MGVIILRMLVLQAINQLIIIARRVHMGPLQLLATAKNAISHLEGHPSAVTAHFLMKEVRIMCSNRIEGGANIYSSCDNR